MENVKVPDVICQKCKVKEADIIDLNETGAVSLCKECAGVQPKKRYEKGQSFPFEVI